ncbi:EamA family transporter [Peribacillus sp. JNUCC 23]
MVFYFFNFNWLHAALYPYRISNSKPIRNFNGAFSWNVVCYIIGPRVITVSLHLGIITTGIAYFLFAKGLISIPSSTAVTLSLAEPLTAALLGVLVNEQLSFTS